VDSSKIRTALVTGGSRRIGAAICHDLAANGFDVAIHHAFSAEEAEELSSELSAHGNRTGVFQGDLTRSGDARRLFGEVEAQLGTIDLLVNNASIFLGDSAYQIDEKLWDDHFAIHTKTPALLAAAMVNQPSLAQGLIVNIIDQRVLGLKPNYYSYTLSKSAMWTATQTMAQQFAPGVRVNAIGPGPTLSNERQSQKNFDAQVAALPWRRGPSLEEFGATIRYLYDTPSITGQMIALDGGQHLSWETPDFFEEG